MIITAGTAFTLNNAQAFGIVLVIRGNFAFVQFQNGEQAYVPLLVVAQGKEELKRHIQ